MSITDYTVEWGHYTYNKQGKKISKVQDGDIEFLYASSEEDAIKKAPVPTNAEWRHAYRGTSKWL